MSLEFGFGFRDSSRPLSDAIWDRKFKALSKEDKQFYQDGLLAAMMMADIGVISEDLIPHLVARVKAIDQHFWYDAIPVKDINSYDYLKRFIGFKANINTTTTADFIRKVTNRIRITVPKLTDSLMREITFNSRDCVLDELKAEELPLFINHKWQGEKATTAYKRRLAQGV